jgi:predicted membrane-bound spermidine synthase
LIRSGNKVLWASGLLFCLSGASALIYQVCWQRMLTLHSGVGVYSIALMVAAFMAGLGSGSYVGGLLSKQMTGRRALAAFALLELTIGLFGMVSARLYYDLFSTYAPLVYGTLWLTGVVDFAIFLFPTALMGMSLPFLVRAVVTDPEVACIEIGYLYGINTLGAGIGSALAPWVLIRNLGVGGAVWAGVGLNLVVALGALALAPFVYESTFARRRPGAAAFHGAEGIESPGRRPFTMWVMLYALSGFCAIGLEIVWLRLMDVAGKSTAFNYGTFLSVFLCGLAAGSIVGGHLAVRIKRPLMGFLVCQTLLGIFAASAIAALTFVPSSFPVLQPLVEYWKLLDPFALGLTREALMNMFRLYVVLPLILYAVPTVIMGVSFAILQRGVQDDQVSSGWKVGVLQAANIAGCAAGSLVVGLIGLELLGTAETLRVLLGLMLVFGVVAFRTYGFRAVPTALVPIFVVLILLVPGQGSLWTRLHGDQKGLMISEDATGVVALIPKHDGHDVFVDGRWHSSLPFGGSHSEFGALPALLHPSPREVAIIGLGSGDTAWSVGFRGETQCVTVFELRSGEMKLLRRLAGEHSYPSLLSFIGDPRVDLIIEDGRKALNLGNKTYDVIQADPLVPMSAYCGNIYSVEFFRLCAARLKSGGIMCQWAPTRRIRASFAAAFPHVLEFRNILVGSNDPLQIDFDSWQSRLSSPQTRAYLGEAVVSMLAGRLTDCKALERSTSSNPELNYDLCPLDEFASPPRKGSRWKTLLNAANRIK